jgi:putative Ca2+/H+ antiporter (TMEM165/GDT1 family)
VLIGLTIGIFINHFLAVLFGAYIVALFPIENITIFVGFIFIIFGFYTLRISKELEDVKKSKVGAIITVAIAMFLGELGDKTQLTAIILASEASYPYVILIGTVSAMVLTSLFGIFIGVKFGSKIPEFSLKVVSSLVFIGFGLIKVIGNLPTLENSYLVIIGSAVLVVLYIILFVRFKNNFKELEQGTLQRKAEELQDYYLLINDKLKTICLGLETCKTCMGNTCLIGYTKSIIKKAINLEVIDLEELKFKITKDYDKIRINEALSIIIGILKTNWNKKEYYVLHELRRSFELVLFKSTIEATSYNEYIKKISN